MRELKSFIVMFPNHDALEISLDDNLSWLYLFYAMPQVLVRKIPKYLGMPRNVYQLLTSDKHYDNVSFPIC